MAFFIKKPIAFPRIFGIGFWRNSIISILLLNMIQNFAGSIRFISQNSAFRNIKGRQQINGNFRIMNVTPR